MPTWNSRGLRGSTLEDLINMSNEKYRTSHLALVQKIPTPIKPINIDQSTRHITLAYFDQKSTVDYIGVVQEFLYVLMQKNVQRIHFQFRTSMNIRLNSCVNLRSRTESPS